MAQIEKPIIGSAAQRWQRSEAFALLESVSRYTRFVSFSKFTLGALSLLMILTIVILPIMHSDKEGLRLAFSSVQEGHESQPMMKNPTFQGVDEDNQPYFVTADSALQHNEDTIIISNVQADMLTTDQSWLSVKAREGTVNNVAKQMQLTEDVRLYHQDGYEFRTRFVDIDMQKRIARGDQPIKGFGPTGEIDAGGFYWDHDAKLMRFTSGVHMRIVKR